MVSPYYWYNASYGMDVIGMFLSVLIHFFLLVSDFVVTLTHLEEEESDRVLDNLTFTHLEEEESGTILFLRLL